MGQPRYITGNEKSLLILEGALVWGRFQAKPMGADGFEKARLEWHVWKADNPTLTEAAQDVQGSALDWALVTP